MINRSIIINLLIDYCSSPPTGGRELIGNIILLSGIRQVPSGTWLRRIEG